MINATNSCVCVREFVGERKSVEKLERIEGHTRENSHWQKCCSNKSQTQEFHKQWMENCMREGTAKESTGTRERARAQGKP